MAENKNNKVIHKRSVKPGSLPTGSTLDFGEIAVNYNSSEPFLSIRTTVSGQTDITYAKFIDEASINDKLSKKSDSSHTHSQYVNQNAFSNVKVGDKTIEADSATDMLELVAGDNVVLTPDTDKDKITIGVTGLSKDGHTHSAYVNQNAFSNVKVSGTTIAADSATDTLELVAGDNVVLTPDTDKDKVTIGVTGLSKDGHTHTITASASDDDVVVLSGTNGTNKVTYTASHAKQGPTSGFTSAATGSTGTISGSGASGKIYIPQIEVNEYGHVTEISDKQVDITMPSIPNGFAKVKVSGTTIEADTTTDTLTLAAGTNVQITADTTNDTVTISAAHNHDTVYSKTGHTHSISALASDDDVVILTSTGGTNGVTYDAKHKTYLTSAFASEAADKTISGSGASASFKVPDIEVDVYGHVTSATDRTISIAMPTVPTSLKNPNSLTIQKNGTTLVTYDGSEAKTANIIVPTKLSDLTNDLADLTVGTKKYDGSKAVEITAADLGLGAALKYCGITTTALTDGAKTNPIVINGDNHTATAGCVVFYEDKEFVFNGTIWELLGAESTYKVVQSEVADPTANGSTIAFIDTLSQDANGKITATKKNVRSATTAQTGVVKLVRNDLSSYTSTSTSTDGLAAAAYHTHSQYQAKGNYKTTQTAVADPTANGSTLAFIDTISQDTNGKITVTKKYVNIGTATTGQTGIVQLVTGDVTGEAYADGKAAASSHNHDGTYLKSYTETYQGTLTGITVTGASGLTGSGTVSAITGKTGGTITLGHDTKTVTVSTSATTLAHKGTFVVPTVTYDEYGHISGLTNTTYTLPSDNNTTTSAGASNKVDTKLFLVGSTKQASSATTYTNSGVYIDSSNNLIASSFKKSDGTEVSYTDTKVTSVDNHYAPTSSTTATNTAGGSTLSFGGAVLTGIQMDAKGHVTGGVTSKLPANPNTDTATTETGHYKPTTSASTIGATSGNNYIRGIHIDSKNHVISVATGTPTNTNTHYTSKNIVGTSTTATTNGAVTGTSGVYLNHLEESEVKSTHNIKGAGTVKVTSDSSGNITITGTDTNTDTKVTSVGNHYTPTSSTTATNTAGGSTLSFGGAVLTGIQMDAKGHVTGGVTSKLPANPDTHYTTHMYLGGSGATADATSDVTNPYIRLFDNTTAREDIQVVGQNNLTVKGKNGAITIDGTHNHDSTYLKSHQTIYDLTLSAGAFSAATFDPNGAAKTVYIPTHTSHLTNNSGFVTNDSNLAWGTTAINGSISPVDAALSNIHSANRLAFSHASGITIEYSQNAGSSWTTYSTTDADKIKLVSGIGSSYSIGGRNSTANTVNDQLRVTLNATNMCVYTRPKKLLLNITTN